MNVGDRADFLTAYFSGMRGETLLPQVLEQEQKQFHQEVGETVSLLGAQQHAFEESVGSIMRQARKFNPSPEQLARLHALEERIEQLEGVQQTLKQGIIGRSEALKVQQKQLAASQVTLQEVTKKAGKIIQPVSAALGDATAVATRYIRES